MKPARESCPCTPDTKTLPLEPVPTMAVMAVSDTTVKDCAAVPPNLTVVVPEKPKPLIDTEVPVVPLAGLNDVICVRFNGGGII